MHLPRTLIAQRAAALTGTSSAKEPWQVLFWYLSEQLGLITTTQDVDLLNSNRVKKAFHHAEDGGEAPRRIYQVELPQPLWIVVLGDCRSLSDIAVYRAYFRNANAFKIHDGATSFEQLSRFTRTSRQARISKLLIFDDKVLQHSFSCGDLVHGGKVNLAQLLNVDWSPLLSTFQSDTILIRVSLKSPCPFYDNTVSSTPRLWASLCSRRFLRAHQHQSLSSMSRSL